MTIDILRFIFKPLTLLSWPPGLPDEKGRVQILTIHTNKMRSFNLLAGDVNIPELAAETKNYSGAELEGLVRAAQSTAMNRHIKVATFSYVYVMLRIAMFKFTRTQITNPIFNLVDRKSTFIDTK